MIYQNELIEMGFCLKPHGVKGGFSFVLYNTKDSCLHEGMNIQLFPQNNTSTISKEGENHKITKIIYGNKVIVYLDNILDRNTVESMIPFTIKIPRSSFPKLDNEDEFYLHDLKGLDVFCFTSKKKIGTVHDFYENGPQVVLVLKLKDKKQDVVFIDNFFPLVDLTEKRIEVILPMEIE